MSDESQFHKHVMSIFFVLLKQVYCIKYRFCFVHLNYTVTYSSTTGLRTAVALKLYTYPITYSSTTGLPTAVALKLYTYPITYSSTTGLRTAVAL